MQLQKRQARAKRRAKTMRLRRTWRGGGLTPGEVQSIRKQARRDVVTL